MIEDEPMYNGKVISEMTLEEAQDAVLELLNLYTDALEDIAHLGTKQLEAY